MTGNSNNPVELYAFNISDIQFGRNLGKGRETTIRTDTVAQLSADHLTTSSDLELDESRDLWNKYKQSRADKIEKELEAGVVSRVKAEWCCRCRVTTKFSEGKCVERYCEHEQCDHCRNFSGRAKCPENEGRGLN